MGLQIGSRKQGRWRRSPLTNHIEAPPPTPPPPRSPATPSPKREAALSALWTRLIHDHQDVQSSSIISSLLFRSVIRTQVARLKWTVGGFSLPVWRQSGRAPMLPHHKGHRIQRKSDIWDCWLHFTRVGLGIIGLISGFSCRFCAKYTVYNLLVIWWALYLGVPWCGDMLEALWGEWVFPQKPKAGYGFPGGGGGGL